MKENDKELLEIASLYSKTFDLDLDYYLHFCKEHTTLDIFAGYGRVTNYLIYHQVDIESVELVPELANLIQLPKEKNHICNVLDFHSERQFERVIAGYNSFCLLREECDIKHFFENLNSWLVTGGMASLSYYHPDYWYVGIDDIIQLEHEGKKIEYGASFDLSKRNEHLGIWIDKYKRDEQLFEIKYPVRVYDTPQSIEPFLLNTSLKIVDVVKNYNKEKFEYPGWIDIVLVKE